jgi:hypothetical protein
MEGKVHGRPKRRWEDCIKTDFTEVIYCPLDGRHSAQQTVCSTKIVTLRFYFVLELNSFNSSIPGAILSISASVLCFLYVLISLSLKQRFVSVLRTAIL